MMQVAHPESCITVSEKVIPLMVKLALTVTPILSLGVNCNAISGQGVHVIPYPNPIGPTSSTRPTVGPSWSSITGWTLVSGFKCRFDFTHQPRCDF